MIRINLLPVKAAQKKEKLRGQLFLLLFCVIVAVAGCAAVYVSLLAKISATKSENARKEQEIERLKKVIGEVGRYKKLQQELQGKLDVLAKLKENKSGPVHLLDELSKALPEKLWLTAFKESAGSVSISGVGLNEEKVAEFLRNLDASPYFQKVELTVVEQTTQGNVKLHKFDLTCKTVAPPTAPAAGAPPAAAPAPQNK
jgi:type IV pilus assembly protein PilN